MLGDLKMEKGDMDVKMRVEEDGSKETGDDKE